MNCPNCGSNMSEKRKRCDRCGEDLTLYKKILRASNLYYNNGLAQAKVRDLSGAIISLRYSLELNKMNTNARNLLGLIYFEMGETVAALSEWVISKHFKAEDNDADEYINEVQSNPTKLETLNQAIKRYNNALQSAKQGSDDLAIIQLKKVTNLNPRFIRAYQLLALLYMKNGDNEKAKRSLLKATKIDVSNTTTLRYMRELEPAALVVKETGGNDTEQVASPIMPVSSYKEDKPNIMAFVNLVIGVVIGIAVSTILIVPSIKYNYKQQDNSYYAEYSAGLAVQEEKEQTIRVLQEEKVQLEETIAELRTQIDSIEEPVNNLVLFDPLFQAAQLYVNEMGKTNNKDRDYEGLAEALAAINVNQLETADSKQLYNRLKAEVYPNAAKRLYDKGYSLYGKYKYEEAIVELEKAFFYDPNHVDAIYYIARTYHRLGDNENAAIYYNLLISDFSEHRRAKQAADYIGQVQTRENE